MPVKRKVSADNLLWAINQGPYDYVSCLRQFPMLDCWVNGTEVPSVKELSEFADYTDVPLGYLLLSRIPKEEIFLLPDHRSDGKKRPWSYGLRKTVEIIQARMEWMSEYRQQEDADPVNVWCCYTETETIDILVKEILTLLGISDKNKAQIDKYGSLFAYLRVKIESIGIIVLASKVVSSNRIISLYANEFDEYSGVKTPPVRTQETACPGNGNRHIYQ